MIRPNVISIALTPIFFAQILSYGVFLNNYLLLPNTGLLAGGGKH